ncbi:hypothetical protein [Nocardiopsis tropica]|uniref:Uncharacterized protein n=1 Tax=Nocardiopsis tropica TaxID=109330 RepID=A0ABU7KT30_9ACTN|nr:hypothetical protein [Nocardiopsis umidischolae]MEE2051807.1 hypothetical protein [Nocardiopsis umidischolae]
MSLPELVRGLAAATVRPATTDHVPGPAPAPCQVIPVQARRRRQDPHVDLIEREHPAWTVHAMPRASARGGADYVALSAGRTVRAEDPEELRRRIGEAEDEPGPALVRPYLT